MPKASAAYGDLPVVRASQVLIEWAGPYKGRLSRFKDRFLMTTPEFLKFVNRAFHLRGPQQFTRRTLQFYSSPHVRLLPLPVYRNRHTAHYVFPDHFKRLAVICTLRDKFFFPIEVIRKLLDGLPEDKYDLVDRWSGSPEDLLDMIPVLKEGFGEEDIQCYLAMSLLLEGDEMQSNLADSVGEDYIAWTREPVDRRLDRQFARVKEWLHSERGRRFLKAKAAATEARSPVSALLRPVVAPAGE